MALTLGQGAQLAANPNYRLRIRYAAVRYAVTVMSEVIGSNTSTVFAKRKQLAHRTIQSPDALLDGFVSMIAADPGASLTWYAPVPITSSTNANPSVVTTTVAHGLVATDVVEVAGHLVNTAINGVWLLATASGSTLTIPTPANGAGGATGTVMKMLTDVEINFTVQNNWNAVAGTYTGEN
jgi:hypothetical protein